MFHVLLFSCTSTNRDHRRHRADHAPDTFKSTSELPPTAGSGRKQMQKVVRGKAMPIFSYLGASQRSKSLMLSTAPAV